MCSVQLNHRFNKSDPVVLPFHLSSRTVKTVKLHLLDLLKVRSVVESAHIGLCVELIHVQLVSLPENVNKDNCYKNDVCYVNNGLPFIAFNAKVVNQVLVVERQFVLFRAINSTRGGHIAAVKHHKLTRWIEQADA